MEKSRWRIPPLTTLAIALGAIVFTLDLLTPMGIAIPVLYPGLVLLGLWSPYPRFALVAAIIATVLSVLGFSLSPPGGVLLISVTNHLMALLIIWVTAFLVLRYKRAEQATKILRGLLPICSHCKKIRGDEGAWQMVEVFVRDHSEADFSHSICPECLNKMYPEFGRNA
jgi:hypothetical protein